MQAARNEQWTAFILKMGFRFQAEHADEDRMFRRRFNDFSRAPPHKKSVDTYGIGSVILFVFLRKRYPEGPF